MKGLNGNGKSNGGNGKAIAKASKPAAKVEALKCRYCGSTDLAPSRIARRDARCKKCLAEKFGAAWRAQRAAVKAAEAAALAKSSKKAIAKSPKKADAVIAKINARAARSGVVAPAKVGGATEAEKSKLEKRMQKGK